VITRLSLVPVILATIMAIVNQQVYADDPDLVNWLYKAEIKTRPITGQGVTEFRLTPEIFDSAQRSLADLRIIADKSEEMPYAMRTPVSRVYNSPVYASLINKSYKPGEESSVTADFHTSDMVKNRIVVRTSGKNYRRRVRVEASDDNLHWKVIRDGAYIFNIPRDNNRGFSVTFNEVGFPDNNQRYLRITVFNDSDDPEKVEIISVNAFRRVFHKEETIDVPIVKTDVTQDEDYTEIELDLGFKNMPLEYLNLDFHDDNFFRSVTIKGRNSEIRTIKSKIEDAEYYEREVEVPWKRLNSTAISRFSSEESREDSTSISLHGQKYRYLLVRIHNRDDKPLLFNHAKVTRSATYVTFTPKHKAQYELYFGNPKARRPKYDFSHYHAKLRKKGVNLAELGPLESNPLYGKKDEAAPWSEKNKWLLWMALLMMIAALGVLVYRVIKTAPEHD
jgi:hypothetical protein